MALSHGSIFYLFDQNSMRVSNYDITMLSNYKGSCPEVDSVYKTMEMLYKVVLFANSAFFSGDLAVAYQVLSDAFVCSPDWMTKKLLQLQARTSGTQCLQFIAP